MALHDPHPLGVDSEGETDLGRPQPLATFGRYLLFKRLRRDALGEVYRAGRLGPASVQRMVSLRLFNGAGIEAERFAQACGERADLRSILRRAPFAEVADSGCENGVAFVAHEFVLGRSLAELLARVREKSDPVLLEHTLLVMDRIALALQTAYQARHDGKRIVHGFLVPEFVHISCEGEIRLSGFESSAGLLDLEADSPARAELAGYLSPEVNAGQPPDAGDDVYSLGSIFAELLTGEPLPALDPSATGGWVDAAMLATSASPLPEKVRLLLRQSLLPRDRRIQNAEKWHRALLELAPDGFGASATFDLAFFMHSLFGAVFEVETELVAAEMEAEIPPPATLSAAAVPAPEAAVADDAPAADDAAAPDGAPADLAPEPQPAEESDPAGPAVTAATPPAPPLRTRRSTTESKAQSAPAESSGRKWIVIAALMLAALGVGLGAAYLAFRPSIRGADAPATLEVAAAPRLEETASTAAVVPADALEGIAQVPPPLSPDELESQVRSLVAERAGDLEANLKEEYDQRLVELRRQLEEARKAAPAPAAAAPPAAPDPVEPAEPAEVTSRTESLPAGSAPAPDRPAAQPESTRRAPQTVATPAAMPELRSTNPPVPAETPRRPEPAAPDEPATLASEPAAVDEGPAAAGGAGIRAPTLLRQPSVVYPPAAARLKQQATVRVRILVDEQGRPSEIEQLGKKAGLGFDAAALQAARTTRWSPALRDGVPVEMWVELAIDFRL